MSLVPMEVLLAPSINQMDIDWISEVIFEKESWMTPIKEHLLKGTILDKRNER